MTPLAGSLVRTRSSRRAAAALPSQTTTMPECCEKPMPVPPPLCIETQVAPEATLSMPLRSGQSATASEPSFIASVSRLGLATEPADACRQSLELDLLARHVEPVVEMAVAGDEFLDPRVGAVDVLRLAREGTPAERADAAAEQRADIG